MTTNLIPEYTTSHIPLAAFLKVRHVRIININVIDRRGVFTFENVPRELIIEFNNGEALVEPAEYADKMSQLTQTAKRLMKDAGV